ncbi:MAG: LURP-one-related family protein [Lactobacillaceae bacterium]|jgi:uncharacterized protein YxjI|nr:LURP-one-related family protein [Lactobacillaceae bacterium]
MTVHYTVKQNFLSMRGSSTITDAQGNDAYLVKGSLVHIPKQFTLSDASGHERMRITKKMISFLPTFVVSSQNKEVAVIKKRLSVIRAKYDINAMGLEIQGSWLDMNFSVTKGNKEIAVVDKRWISVMNTYDVAIEDEAYTEIILGLVIAINFLKDEESGHNN